MPRSQKLISVTIDNSGSVSGAFDLFGYKVAGVVSPVAWTAADFTFQVDAGDGTFRAVTDNSGAYVKISGVATGASEVMTPPEIGDRIVGEQGKIVSTNTASEAVVAQGAERIVKVILVPLA